MVRILSLQALTRRPLGINKVVEGKKAVFVTPKTDLDKLVQQLEKLGLNSGLDYVEQEPGVLQGLSQDFYSLDRPNADTVGTVSGFISSDEKKYLLTCHHVLDPLPPNGINLVHRSTGHSLTVGQKDFKLKNEEDDLCLLELGLSMFDFLC